MNRGCTATGRPVAPFPVARPGRPAIWNVRPRDPLFVGRDGVLGRLHRELCPTTGTGGRAIGLVPAPRLSGGVGRTQLAVEYAHRRAGSYRLVWWIDADTPLRARSGLADLAARVVGRPAGSRDSMIARLWDELGQRRDWLLIYDNVDAPLDLGIAAPPDTGKVIMIGGGPEIARLAPVLLEVGELDRREAIGLLQGRSQGQGARAAGPTADLAAALGDVALAVALAGRFLARTGLPVSDYLALLRQRAEGHRRECTGSRSGRPARYLDAVVQTGRAWLAATDPVAAGLLEATAFLAPAPLPHPVVAEVRELAALGLVSRHGAVLRPHSSVQEGLRAGLPGERRAPALLRAQDLLAPLDRGAVACRSRLAAAEPHVRAVTSWISLPHPGGGPAEHEPFRRLTLGVAGHLQACGEDDAARALCAPARLRWAGDLGPDHPDVLDAADLEAAVLADGDGDLPAARQLLLDVHARRARPAAERHRSALRTAGNLARVHAELDDCAASAVLYEETLARARDVLGPDDPDTLGAAHGLGDVLIRLGHFAEAADLLRDTWARRVRTCGADQVDTDWTAAALGVALRGLGRPQEARALHEQVLARARERLGDEHPQTLYAAVHLAADLTALGAADLGRDVFTEVLGWELFGWDGGGPPPGPRAGLLRWAARHRAEIAKLWTDG